DELAELETIGTRFAGSGPALMTEYEPYGVRHFLRALDPEGASELRRRPVPLRSRRLLGKAEYADLDAFALDGLLVYRTLVIRRSPLESRPPVAYRRVWSGRFYDVWQRSDRWRVLADLPLGTGEAAAPAPCASVLRLADLARRSGGSIAAASAPDPLEVTTGSRIRVPLSGRYRVWIRGGPVAGRLVLDLDGKALATVEGRMQHSSQFVDLG